MLFAKKGFETYGVEPTQSGFDYCKKWLKSEGLEAYVRIGEMTSLPYENNYFDCVISWNVIYHGTLNDLKKALKEIYRVTRLNGLAFIILNSTKNKHYKKGTEVETNTFLDPEKYDGNHLHHYSDENEVRSLFSSWQIISLSEAEQQLEGKIYPKSYHWKVLARKI